MSESKHAGDDDLYGGFGVENTTSSDNRGNGLGSAFGLSGNPFGAIGMPGTANVNNPIRGAAPITGRMTGRMTGRLQTGQTTETARPMTSVKGAGYQSKPGTAAARSGFDPLSQQALGPAPPLEEKTETSAEDKARDIEKKVNALIEASAEAASKGDPVLALERAKEAGRKERQLCKFRESKNLMDNMNVDLTYCVIFNLASAYATNGMYQEALNSYTLIVKNKSYPTGGRLRVNMGNIYFAQKQYPKAITQYQMALDQLPNIGPEERAYTELRLRIARNIGVANIKMGRFAETTNSFESVMQDRPDFQAAFDLLLCYYARGETEQMKKTFQRLLQIPLPGGDIDDEESKIGEDDEDDVSVHMHDDPFKEEIRRRQTKAKDYIITAAKLIAPAIVPEGGNWQTGYDWVIELLRMDYDVLASEMLIIKALAYLKYKQFDRAIEELKAFEKKDKHLKARAAVNLAFLYLLEGDIKQATKYAELSVKHERYNAKALVNMGICLSEKGELERAKEMFLEAIGVEADCVEAIFDLGLISKQVESYGEALQAFEKLQTIIPGTPEVLYQIGNVQDLMGNTEAAIDTFNTLITKLPSDPGILARLGQICAKIDDETQAYHYHSESYRFLPTNLDVISWLGIWFVKSELYEKAIEFFDRAAEVQPQEVKWRLMVASCYRRMGDYQLALEKYEEIHTEFPDNIECLSYLVALCRDLGRNYQQYESKLVRLERTQALQTQASMTQQNAYYNGDDLDASASLESNRFAPTYEQSPSHTRARADAEHDASIHDHSTASTDPGFGASNDRYAAPNVSGPSPIRNGEMASRQNGGADEDDFADADLDDLLAD